MVIAAYRPRPGSEARLLELAKEHYPILRQQNLVTDRRPVRHAQTTARSSRFSNGNLKRPLIRRTPIPKLLKMWERYSEVCEFVPLITVKECSEMFAMFEPV